MLLSHVLALNENLIKLIFTLDYLGLVGKLLISFTDNINIPIPNVLLKEL